MPGSLGIFSQSLIMFLMISFEDFKIIAWNIRGALHEHGKLAI
jgi:hypothetical protein